MKKNKLLSLILALVLALPLVFGVVGCAGGDPEDEEQTYSITYVNVEEATFSSANPTSYKSTDNDITLVNPSKDGYTFMGWYLDQEFNSAITEITASTNGNLTLYAKWQQNAQGGGCGGSFDTGIIVAIVVLIAGVALVLKKKYGRN